VEAFQHDDDSMVKMQVRGTLPQSGVRPFSERLLRLLTGRNSPGWRLLIAAVLLAMMWLASVDKTASSQRVHTEEDYHQFFTVVAAGAADKSNPMHRCIDSDDDPREWEAVFVGNGTAAEAAAKAAKCACQDPLVPVRRSEDPVFDEHQKRLAISARNAAVVFSQQDDGDDGSDDKDDDNKINALDFVMVGDSIIERWNGTRGMGQMQAPEYRQVFDQYFSRKSGGGPLNAVALGASGDTSNNLLWRIERGGMIPDNLNPRAWLIMVGTNDIGRTGCSKRMTLAGILQVAQVLHQRRPKAKIIVHGKSNDDDDDGRTFYYLDLYYLLSTKQTVPLTLYIPSIHSLPFNITTTHSLAGLLPRSDHYDTSPLHLDADYSLGYDKTSYWFMYCSSYCLLYIAVRASSISNTSLFVYISFYHPVRLLSPCFSTSTV